MSQGQYSPIVQYQPSREMDFAVLAMQETMREAWDIDYLLSPSLHTPSGMLTYFQQWPLYVQFYNNQIVHAAWFLPFMGAAVMDFWVHPDYRRKRQAGYFLFELLQGAFDMGVSAVIGWIQEREDEDTTRQFIRLHEKFGYEYSGLMKKCFEGQDCHVVVLTQEGFEEVPDSRLKRQWLKTRG